jgi:hypothetical protein
MMLGNPSNLRGGGRTCRPPARSVALRRATPDSRSSRRTDVIPRNSRRVVRTCGVLATLAVLSGAPGCDTGELPPGLEELLAAVGVGLAALVTNLVQVGILTLVF